MDTNNIKTPIGVGGGPMRTSTPQTHTILVIHSSLPSV
jgi:hypothetical protein